MLSPAILSVRRVSTVTAAHELPAIAEEALLLWLSKVSEAVMCTRKDKIFEVTKGSCAVVVSMCGYFVLLN